MIQNADIVNPKPSIASIEMTTGVVVGTWMYNQAGFTYNQVGLQYGGFAGGAGNSPLNLRIEDSKPSNQDII